MLTTDPKDRKQRPIARGVLDYFPLALAEIAHVSFIANEQHNPGEPMRWAKEKSTDHADSLTRHLLERGKLDTDGLRHTAKVAWRALALLQIELEQEAAGVQNQTWCGDAGEQRVPSASEAIDEAFANAQIGEHDDYAAASAYEAKARQVYGDNLEQPFADEDTIEDGTNEHTTRYYVARGGFFLDTGIAYAVYDTVKDVAHAVLFEPDTVPKLEHWSGFAARQFAEETGDWIEVTQAEAFALREAGRPEGCDNWPWVEVAGYRWSGEFRTPRDGEFFAAAANKWPTHLTGGVLRADANTFGGTPRYIVLKK